MRCPNCRERVARFVDDGLLVTGRYTLFKSETDVETACRKCGTRIMLRKSGLTRKPTLVRVRSTDADKQP